MAPPSLSVQRRKATLAHPMPRESREESITSAEADGAREVGGGSAAAHARRSLAGALGGAMDGYAGSASFRVWVLPGSRLRSRCAKNRADIVVFQLLLPR